MTILDHLRRAWFAWLVIRQVHRFIDSKYKLRWVYLPYGKFYFRKSMRFIHLPMRSFEVASVEIVEYLRGHGLFSVALEVIEKHAAAHDFDIVLVECVHNERLHDWLLRRGYYPMPMDPLSLYRSLR